MIKNRFKIGAALALTAIMMGLPLANASADSNNLNDTESKNGYTKEQFQKEYGIENKFNTTYEDEEVKEEANGATGQIRITDKLTGEVMTFNYFEELEEDEIIEKMNDEELGKYFKEKFQKEYGREDKFNVAYEDEEVKEEANGATGEFRRTDKSTGEVITFNYVDELVKQTKVSRTTEKMSDEELLNRLNEEIKK